MGVTKLYRIVENLTGGKTFSVKGFQSAKLAVEITEVTDSLTFGIYADAVDASSSDVTTRPPVYLDGVLQTGNITLTATGKYEILIDLTNVGSLRIVKVAKSVTDTSVLSCSYDAFKLPALPTETIPQSLKADIPKNVTNYDVSAYQSAKMQVTVTAGKITFGIRADKVGTSNNYYAPVYYNGELIKNNITLGVGEHELLIDLNNTAMLSVNKVVNEGGTISADTTTLYCFQKPFAVPKIEEEEEIVVPDNYLAGKAGKTFAVPNGAKQVDIFVSSVTKPTSSTNMYLRVKGSVDGVNYKDVPFYNNTLSNIEFFGYVQIVKDTDFTLQGWLNVEEYRFIQLNYSGGNTNEFLAADVEFTNVYKEREVNVVDANANAGYNFYQTNLLKGYKAAKLNISATLANSNAYITVYPTKAVVTEEGKLGEALACANYTNYGEEVAIGNNIYLGATMENGMMIVVSEKAPATWYFNFVKFKEDEAEAANATEIVNATATMMAEPCFAALPVVRETNDYTVKEQPTTTANRDVYGKSIVEWDSDSLSFYPYGYGCFCYKVTMGTSVCPDWMEGEQISFVSLLPYNEDDKGLAIPTLNGRGVASICVFTTKGRILHNNPKRYDITEKYKSNIMLFDESLVVENINSLKWLPTDDISKEKGIYKYFPVLTDYDYNQFNGRFQNWGRTETINTQLEFTSTSSPNTLYHQKNRNAAQWRRLNFGNMAKDDKVCVFANYNGNEVGQEPVMIATNNGGRRWDVLPKFACVEHYKNMYAGNVDMSKIGTYTENSLMLCRCAFNVPTAEQKEPATAFIVPEEQQTLITAMSTTDGVTTITTADDLSFDDAESPRVFLKNVSAGDEWNCVCNPSPLSENNGVFFRAIRTGEKTYTLKADLGDAYQSDRICRHFHNIARTSNGFIICTGESYSADKFQGGFLYFLAQNQRDGFASVATKHGAMIDPASITRLTSSKDGVVRASGAFMFCDEADPTILYVSDEPNYLGFTGRKAVLPEGRSKELDIVPIGIFAGKLSQIDEQSKFKCLLDTRGMVTSLVHNMGHFAADGFNNSIYLSADGKKWHEYANNGEAVNGTDLEGRIYFGNKVVEFK